MPPRSAVATARVEKFKPRRNIVGPRIGALRYRLGWSQPFLATQCQLAGWDINRFTIARIERGTCWAGDFELLKLARILHVSAATLISPLKVTNIQPPVQR